MASTSNASTGVGADDNPIVLTDSPPLDRRSINFLLNQQPNTNRSPSQPRPLPRSERTRQRSTMPHLNAPEAPPNIIDLTEEPDEPAETRLSASAAPLRLPQWLGGGGDSQTSSQGTRNPRRTNSTRISPPMLTRSDSTLMGGRHSIIDLTQDSPEETRQSRHTFRPSSGPLPRLDGSDRASRRRTAGHHHHHHHLHDHRGPQHPHRHHRPVTNDEIVEVVTAGMVGDFMQNSLVRNGLRHYHGFFSGIPALARAFNPPQLDVTRNAFASPEEPPQPPMDQIPPARSGFTRDTHAEADPEEGEAIAICPACQDELAYDPADASAQKGSGSSTGSKKRKRAPGEHHFWALKACGHVYCADCFENRRPSKSNPGAAFQFPKGRTGAGAQDIRCAVDGCDTKVGPKGEWVGIFL
ncbi:cell cycle control protein [Sarocladium implicatum]|nr:cell cycle control protein [Sarocladium implicatum]